MSVSPASSSTMMRYRSYLVRIWQSHEHGSYRASAQCVQTGNTVRFGELAQLLAFLQSEVNAPLIVDAAAPPADTSPADAADENNVALP